MCFRRFSPRCSCSCSHFSLIQSWLSVADDGICAGVFHPLGPPNVACSRSRSFAVHPRLLASMSVIVGIVDDPLRPGDACGALDTGGMLFGRSLVAGLRATCGTSSSSRENLVRGMNVS